MQSKERRDLISNEDMEIIVDRKIYTLCNDCYQTLGWKTIGIKKGITSVKIRLERKRQIKNKVELCRLQLEYEDILTKLEKIEKEKRRKTRILILTMGVAEVFHLMWKEKSSKDTENLSESDQYYDSIYSLKKRANQFFIEKHLC